MRRTQLLGLQGALAIEKLIVIPLLFHLLADPLRGTPVFTLLPALLVLTLLGVGALVAHAVLFIGLWNGTSWAWNAVWTAGWGLVIFDAMVAFTLFGLTGSLLLGAAALMAVLFDAMSLWQARDAAVAVSHHRGHPHHRY